MSEKAIKSVTFFLCENFKINFLLFILYQRAIYLPLVFPQCCLDLAVSFFVISMWMWAFAQGRTCVCLAHFIWRLLISLNFFFKLCIGIGIGIHSIFSIYILIFLLNRLDKKSLKEFPHSKRGKTRIHLLSKSVTCFKVSTNKQLRAQCTRIPSVSYVLACEPWKIPRAKKEPIETVSPSSIHSRGIRPLRNIVYPFIPLWHEYWNVVAPIPPPPPHPLCSPLLHIEASHPNTICSEHTGIVERSPYSDSALAKVFSTPVNVAHIGPSVRCSEFNSLYIRYYKYNII